MCGCSSKAKRKLAARHRGVRQEECQDRQAEGRFRAGDRHRIVCARSSHVVRRPARVGLYRDRSARREDRFALRRIRRSRAQCDLRAGRDPQQAERRDGKVLIPGFYDAVQKPTDDELKAWESLPFNEEDYRKAEVGSDVLTGEPGYSVLYRTWARPTLEVHGIVGGFRLPARRRSFRRAPRRRSQCGWCRTRMPTTSSRSTATT